MALATTNVGVYTLANDRVVEWLTALVRSIRAHDPGLSITVIPYDDRLTKVRRLRAEFGFDILRDPKLVQLDEMGRQLWPDRTDAVHLMRKFAAFWGPYDEFIFCDADAIVLQPLSRLFQAHGVPRDRVFYFEHNLNEVYTAGRFRGDMVAGSGARGFNTGAFGASAGAVDIEDVRAAARSAAPVQKYFVDIGEQSFLNFVVDLSALRPLAYADVLPGIGASWAGAELVRTARGWFETGRGNATVSGPAPMIHWAGYTLAPTMPYYGEWVRYRLGAEGPARRVVAYKARQWAEHGLRVGFERSRRVFRVRTRARTIWARLQVAARR